MPPYNNKVRLQYRYASNPKKLGHSSYPAATEWRSEEHAPHKRHFACIYFSTMQHREITMASAPAAAPSSLLSSPPTDEPSPLVAILSTSTADEGEFGDLDAMDFLRVGPTQDKYGRPVLMVIARNFRPRDVPVGRLQRYFLARSDSLAAAGPYTLVWIHTRSTYWTNCPSIWWLYRTYQRLPSHYHSNLAAVYVLHCDLSLWTTCMAVLPWLSGQLWRKVTWISRVEFLWDYMGKTPLPPFVCEHDAVLEDQPLMDYGLVTSKEMAAAGMPNPM